MKEKLKHNLFYILIFITGGVVLALEVLASRIMTPYFGVSLYIWAGILSMTLIFLSAGYYFGGYVSKRLNRKQLELLYLCAPVAASLGMAISIAIYPLVFPMLSKLSLTWGSFVASTLLLLVPLVSMSAMNPLLVAWQKPNGDYQGDAGAGSVFFISTVGSVAGVIITAFFLIPNLTNYSATLILTLFLCGMIILLSFLLETEVKLKRRLQLACFFTIVVSGVLLAGKNIYFDSLARLSDSSRNFKVFAEYTSIFGNLKVVEVSEKMGTGEPVLYSIQDGLVQNEFDKNGVSISPSLEVVNTLIKKFSQPEGDVLILGLGAGVLSTKLTRQNYEVTIVEINRDSYTAAVDYFNFNPDGMNLVWQDARTYVSDCDKQYDTVVIDLFHNDSTPDYLMTEEFFRDVSRCLRPDGVSVMNAFFESHGNTSNKYLLKSVSEVFSQLEIYHDQRLSEVPVMNAYIVATNGGLALNAMWNYDGIPEQLRGYIKNVIKTREALDKNVLEGVASIRDDHNIYSILNSNTQQAYRRFLVSNSPPHILVN